MGRNLENYSNVHSNATINGRFVDNISKKLTFDYEKLLGAYWRKWDDYVVKAIFISQHDSMLKLTKKKKIFIRWF